MKHISFDDPAETLAGKLGFAAVQRIAPVVQTGVGVFNACGIACVLMIHNEANDTWTDVTPSAETVSKWGKIIDVPQDGTTPADLARMFTMLGDVPTRGGAATYPYIELIYYDRLDHALQWSVYRGHVFNHWIVRTDAITYFDPLFPQGQGGPIKTTQAILDHAEIDPGSRVAIVAKFKELPSMPIKAPVRVAVRVRTGPEVSDATWTPLALKEGQVVEGVAENGWLKYADPRFTIYDTDGNEQDALYSVLKWNGIEYITVPSDPAPPITPPAGPANFKMGVSVLTRHDLLNAAYDAGCRAFLIMEGLLAAVQFKMGHQDAVVMYRKYLGHGGGIPDANLFSSESRMGNGVVFVTPLNECDGPCYGSPGEIEQRAKFDAALGAMCKQHGTIYAAGGFSMGTPDFTNPAICDAMRRHYAPAYNAGVFGMNMHLYSPTMQHVYDPNGLQWYERRWEFLFTKCGFDPSPNLLGIYSDETGVDEGGVGGFPAHHAGSQDVQKWSAEFAKVSKAPLVVNGVAYPSPMRGAAIFQAGHQDWRGYSVEPWFAEIGKANL